jgi:anaerobic selenocysteine-containing dehydrogenase
MPYATCHLCEAICGIEVDLDAAGNITKIRGDEHDPFSRGYICPKATAIADLTSDPNRVRAPLRRLRGGDDTFHEVSWDEALSEAAARITDLQSRYGRDSVAIYAGNPSAHSYSGVLSGLALAKVLDSKNRYSANGVDALPRLLTSYLVFGSQAIIPIPDLDRTDFLLILGANPVISNGSIMTAPNMKRRLEELRARGGAIVVVDPRRTETAELATRHLPIVPGADALLLAALVHVIFEEGRGRSGKLEAMTRGLDDVRRALAPFTPEAVAPATGLAAADITALARDFAAAPSAVAYGRLGTCAQEFGALATWLCDVLNIVTGNLDRAGGAMFPSPAVDLAALAARLGESGSFGTYKSRVRGLPEFSQELPVVALAEEIETPGDGQIRGLITLAGNPALSVPNSRRLERALGKLDLLISIDIYKNETSRFADLILPTSFGLEHDHFPLLFHALAVRNTVKYSPAIVAKPQGVRHDSEILFDLAARIAARRLTGDRAAAALGHLAQHLSPRAVLAASLRFGRWGKGLFGSSGLTLAQLEADPHGIDLGPLEPRLPAALVETKGVIRIAPKEMLADMKRLADKLVPTTDVANDAALSLIGRRSLRSNNSWMHNSKRLVKGPVRCTLMMHPEDATARGLSAGDRVRVASRVGAVEVPLEITEDVRRGVVSLPHGWGHDRDGAELDVAREHAGVSMNDLTDETLFDALSGCGSLSGIPVRVDATTAQDTAS